MNNNKVLSFSDILYRERNKMNMSLKALSEFIGEGSDGKPLLSPSYLNRLEKKEAENPSFMNVCILSRGLNLDLNEVFDSFGFNDLINKAKGAGEIQDILRLNDIKVPLNNLLDTNLQTIILDFEEKETLISIINIILKIGINDGQDTLTTINDLINKIGLYKDVISKYKEKDSEPKYDMSIKGTRFKFSFGDSIIRLMSFFDITIEDISEVLKPLEKVENINGALKIRDKMNGLSLVIDKMENEIVLKNIER